MEDTPGSGLRRRDAAGTVLAALVVVLLVIVAVVFWRRQYYATPDCARYGALAPACARVAQACGSDGRCLNAVAHCMPLAGALGAAGAAGVPLAQTLGPGGGARLRACTEALTRVDPAVAASVAAELSGGQACLPAPYAAALADPGAYCALQNVAGAVAPLIPYSLSVARALPACS
jgi:hypothetical protein